MFIAHQLFAAASSEGGGGTDWVKYGSLILGAYGAIVASVVAFYNYRRDRPKVKVQLIGNIHLGEPNKYFWEIRVLNDSTRPIAIESVGLVDRDGVHLAALAVDEEDRPMSLPFPATLGDGDPPVTVRTRRTLDDGVVGAYAMDYQQKFYEGKAAVRVWAWSPNAIKGRRRAKDQEKALRKRLK